MERDIRSPSSEPDEGRTSGDDFDQRDPWGATLRTTDQYYLYGDARIPHIQRRSYCDILDQVTHMQFDEDHRSRFTSPTYSSTSAGAPSVDSSRSDCDGSPRLKTERVDHLLTPPSLPMFDSVPLAPGGYAPWLHHTAPQRPYVAMHDVQAQVDDDPDEMPTPSLGRDVYPYMRPPTLPYSSYGIHEGFVPEYGQAGTAPDIGPLYDSRDQNRDRPSGQAEDVRPVNFRHRRTPSATTDRTTSGRVQRPANSRPGSSNHQSIRSRSSSSPSGAPNQLPCLFAVYGCDRQFTSKNEWKRHIQTQHVQLEYWRCIQCFEGPCSEECKDFNRKDLFAQHILRMHSAQSAQSTARGGKVKSDMQRRYEDSEAERCRRTMRQPPEACRCIVCEQSFSGPGSWEQCIDHVGKHLDTAAKDGHADVLNPRGWRVDDALQQYLHRENIVTFDAQGYLVLC